MPIDVRQLVRIVNPHHEGLGKTLEPMYVIKDLPKEISGEMIPPFPSLTPNAKTFVECFEAKRGKTDEVLKPFEFPPNPFELTGVMNLVTLNLIQLAEVHIINKTGESENWYRDLEMAFSLFQKASQPKEFDATKTRSQLIAFGLSINEKRMNFSKELEKEIKEAEKNQN